MLSRSFIRTAMFDLKLKWTVGVGDRGRANRQLPEEAVKNSIHPLISCASLHFRNRQVTNNYKSVSLKTFGNDFRQKQTHFV